MRPADTSQVQFTSGTTGFPKGAELSHAGIFNNARLFAHRATFPLHGRHSNPMPYFHCGGCVMSTLGSLATGSAQMPAVTFDPARITRTIEEERCTSVSMVPTMMIGLEEQVAATAATSARCGSSSPAARRSRRKLARAWMERYGVGINNTYGMTECSPVVCATLPGDPVALQTRTVGPPLPHVEVDVVAPGGTEPVALGRGGRAALAQRDGDEGLLGQPRGERGGDRPRRLHALRRPRAARPERLRLDHRPRQGVIIRGGENIYPAEVENAIRELDAVADVAVIGVPDERYGEVCAAYVRTAEGASLTAEELREQLQGRVARYKIPAHLRLVDSLPLTPSGKIQKFKLRERFLGEPPGEAGNPT